MDPGSADSPSPDDRSDGFDPHPPPGPAFAYDPDDLIDLFQTGQFQIEGRMADSSNATLMVVVHDDDRAHGIGRIRKRRE